jgi:exodeoxyribonuclease V gamma subunit
VTVQRCRPDVRGKQVSVSVLGPLGDSAEERVTTATRALHQLVDLRARGLSAPVPLLCEASAAYAEAVWANRNQGRRLRPRNRAVNTWEGDWYPESAQPEHQAVLGADLPFDQLFAEPPADDEHGEGWDEEETSRFGRWALTVWAPLLAHETLEDR